jgi:hypothetical protein
MEPEYEIQTMQKDINKLAKKTAINEPISTQQNEPAGGPPEKLPVENLPGVPLPSEPMVSEQVELPERPEPILPPIPSEDEEPHRTKKVFIPIALAIAVLLVGAGVYYWWNYMRPPEPTGFLEADDFETIALLDIDIPADISHALGEKYTFFVYKQENRAGFMAEIIEREILEAALKDWEYTMPEDLKPIFLDQEFGEPATEAFQDGLYKGVNIRYLNFTNSTLSIDYALVGNYFVITTSKESMFKVIDGVLAP